MNLAYFASSDIIQEINDYFEEWIYAVSGTVDEKIVLPMVNNGFLSAMNQIYKNKSPFNCDLYRIEYPFLDHDIVDLGLFHAQFWPGNEMEKRTLKKILEKRIQSELVYRKKQGFVPPLKEQFASAIIIENLESITNNNSLLSEFINQSILKKAIEHLKQKKLLPFQTYNFLWVAFMVNSITKKS